MIINIITRHLYNRPASLRHMAETVQAQTYPHIEHTVITDRVGHGVIWADGVLSYTRAQGDYVMTIDDDDLLNHPTAVAELVEFIWQHDSPPAVMCRMKSVTHRMLPPADLWMLEPVCGAISGQNIISRADVWNAHHQEWAKVVPGDFGYIRSVWAEHGPAIRWMDAVLVDQQYRGFGRGEDEIDG